MSNLQSYFVAGPENLFPHHILKNEKPEKALIRIVSELSENGLDVFQLRAKSMKDIEIIELIKDLRSATSKTKMKICINDNVNVASNCIGLIDILHLGQTDTDPNEAKKLIDDNIQIGLSITNENQMDNIPNCVNYLGVGPIFPTGSKNDASKPIGSNTLKEIINKTSLPVVAIGGISLDDVCDLFKIGVSGVAVISAILNENNPIENFQKIKENIIKGLEK
jgi:thiamine-phosphate pyrophosphorylase